MGQKLSEPQLKFYKRIDEILWNDWDPIGINYSEEARDEYQSYLPQVFSMSLKNASSQDIAGYLFEIETNHIEMPGTLERCISIAEKILEEKNKLLK